MMNGMSADILQEIAKAEQLASDITKGWVRISVILFVVGIALLCYGIFRIALTT